MLFTKKKFMCPREVLTGEDDGASVFILELGRPSELSGGRMESGTSSTPKLDNLPTSAQSSGLQTDLPHGNVILPLCGFYSETFYMCNWTHYNWTATHEATWA